MPHHQKQPQEPPTKKTSKKGHAPAHQNTFAFHHNPKSKKTATILASPIVHVCRRCHDKLEWKKQYRKYKPRSVLGKCNICEKRNITAAYHTICESCTRTSDKARTVLQGLPQDAVNIRVCAICVTEPALLRKNDPKSTIEASTSTTGKLQLRQVKTLQRQQVGPAKSRRTKNDDDDNDEDEKEEGNSIESEVMDEDDIDDEIDPFLQAVGGADKLLTGEAYQAHLLQQQVELVKLEK